MLSNRDNFAEPTKRIIAERVNYLCSNPDCRKGTSGPKSDGTSTRTGIAAHICAAAKGGPRYNPNMRSSERKSAENGIWLCSNCSAIVDKDPAAYPVEKLKEWKTIAEDYAKKIMISQPIENMYLNNNPYNAILDNSEQENYNNFVSLNSFHGISNEFLNEFSPLNDYLYSELYSFVFEKKYDFTDYKLLFLKDIFQWLIGKKEFPKDKIKKFYQQCNDQVKKINVDINLLEKRWNAFICFFSGDLKNANKIYLKIIDSLEFKKCDIWVKDDILIDGRNMDLKLRNGLSYYVNNIFQQEIRKNLSKRSITYPRADRIKCDLYESILDNIFKYNNLPKNSGVFGDGMQYILSNVQELVYITLIMGSITHFLLVRKVLSYVFTTYSNCFQEDSYYAQALKFKILSSEYKEFSTLFNNINHDRHFVYSNNFINEILKLRKYILEYEYDNFDILIYNIYGRNLNDDNYSKYENSILNTLAHQKSEYVLNALKSIPNNIHRFINIEKLLNLLKGFIDNKRVSYYRECETIINKICFTDLDENVKRIYIDLVSKCIDESDIFIDSSIIEIKKAGYANKKINNYFKNNDEIKFLYKLNIYNKTTMNNKLNSIIYIVNELKKIAIERINYPDKYTLYGINYDINELYFSFNKNNLKFNELIKSEIIPLAKMVLETSNQSVNDKTKMLKTLSYILVYNSKYNSIVCDIVDNINKDCRNDFFDICDDAKKIDVYLYLFDYFNGKLSLDDLLNKYKLMVIDDIELISSVSDVVTILNKFKKITNKRSIESLYQLFKMGMTNKHYIRKEVIKYSYIFINTSYFEDVLNDINNMIYNCDYSDAISVMNMIYSLNNSQKHFFSDIIDSLSNSKNYNIRYVIEKYFR